MSGKSRQKKPLQQRVTIYLDDEPLEALGDARTALAQAERSAQDTYERKLALVKATAPPAVELLKHEEQLRAQMEASLTEARAAVEVAEDAVREASQEYVFRSPGRRRFEDLVAAHEPTDDDHDRIRTATGRAEALARWHDETFIPALIAMCAVDPEVSLDEARVIYDEWTDSEIDRLFSAALLVCEGARHVDLGKGSRAASKRG